MLKPIPFLLLIILLGAGAFAQTAHLSLPIAHTAEVNSVQYSGDGKYVLSASNDRSVKVFEAATGKELMSLSEINAPVKMAVFSPDQKQVLLCFYGTALIYELPSGKLLFGIEGNRSAINHVAYSPDGRYCLTVCDDKTVRVYNPLTGKLIHALANHTEAIKYAEFSPDSKRIVTAAWDHTAMLFDVVKGTLIHTLKGHEGNLNTAHFSEDGKTIITSSWDKTAKLFDANTGGLLATYSGHGKTVVDAQLNGKGIAATISMDGFTRLFDAPSGKLLLEEKLGSSLESMAISSNGSRLLSADRSGECMLLDLGVKKRINRWMGHKGSVQMIAAHPAATQFITASNDYSMHEYAGDGQLILSIQGQTEPIADFVFSANGKWMAAIYQDSIIRVISVENGQEVNRYVPGGMLHVLAFHPNSELLATGGQAHTLYVHETGSGVLALQRKLPEAGAIRGIHWDEKGKALLLTGDSKVASIIEYESGKVIRQLLGHTGPILAASLSSKGAYAITASLDSTVRVYDYLSGENIHTYTGFMRKLNHVAFSPDALQFAYCEGFTIYIHETLSGKLLHTLKEHSWFVHDMAYSPNGAYLLTGGADNQAILYDVQSGRMKYAVSGNGAPVYSVSFNNTGSYLALAGGDQLVHVYETASGKELHSLQGHFAPLRKVAFSPDGVHLLSIGRGHQAVLWDFETGKQMYSRLQLTHDDWLLYDSDFRYDGSPGARSSLYLVCGLESIDLDLIKDALYVPGLAKKQFYHHAIDYPKLSELEVCGTLPIIQPKMGQVDHFEFQINEREAEVEEVEIYVNNRLTKTIPKSSLKTVDGKLMLDIPGQEIAPLFSSTEPNQVEIVAVTSSGGKDIKSRGIIELPGQTNSNTGVVPNVYAVMIGVNSYQDPGLKLSYPVKDARALGNAIELAAGEFLGPEHIFMYHINSQVRGANGYATPERDNIRRALAEIGTKAKPEDVVLIFFAGHGMMKGLVDQKFTLLTSEATKENPVGISTTDLQSWLSPEGPHKMKANKMVLIFDACHSGQASKELFTMMSYNEDRTNRIRQMEDLREKSGLLIMAASAPNQSAYELPQFEQGLLTYCLLKTLKSSPDILDDREFVNVTKWFLESERELQKIMTSLGKIQDAQPFGTANLRIGMMNDSIRSTIHIAAEMPQVFCQGAENSETFGDDLYLQQTINRTLEVSARGEDAKIGFVSRQTSTAHTIKVKYSVKKGKVKCKVILLKNNMPYFQEDLIGSADEVDRLAAQIVRLVEANVHP